jgi:hypothetical protein
MSTLTIRIPEGKHERLRTLAKARGISINRLMDELASVALTEYDSETRSGRWQRIETDRPRASGKVGPGIRRESLAGLSQNVTTADPPKTEP